MPSIANVLAQSAPIQNDIAENSFWSILPNLLWFALTVITLILLRRTLMKLVDVLLWRLRMGSAIKVASLEIGAAIATDEKFESGSAHGRRDCYHWLLH